MTWRSLRAGGWIHAMEFDHESKVYKLLVTDSMGELSRFSYTSRPVTAGTLRTWRCRHVHFAAESQTKNQRKTSERSKVFAKLIMMSAQTLNANDTPANQTRATAREQ